jgi:copper resistance protein D
MEAVGLPLAVILSVHMAAVEIAAGALIFLHTVARPCCIGEAEIIAQLAIWSRRLGILCLAAAGTTLFGWLWLVTQDVADAPGHATLPQIALVATQTQFGHVWIIRTLFVLFAGIGVLRRGRPKAELGERGLASCLLLLLSLSFTSHAAAGHAHGYILVHALHLAATAAWAGSLPPLVFLLSRAGRVGGPWAEVASRVVRRYAVYGTVAVTILLTCGIVLATAMLDGRLSLEDVYTRTLIMKVALFAAMGVLGAINRFVLTPRLLGGEGKAFGRMYASTLIELVLALAVLCLAAILSQTSPP